MRVSVAIATYNGARFIREQLESILSGTVVPDQIVISDDQSTDETLVVVEDVFAAITTVELVMIRGDRTLGVTANFERALSACTGDLIVLSDQDDLWHANRLEVALPAFTADAGLLLQHANARLVDGAGESLGTTLFDALAVRADERAAIVQGHPFDAYIRRNLATGATVVLRRELVQRARPFPAAWVHDEWLAIIAAAVGTVGIIDQPLIDYRQHGGNQIGVAKPTLGYLLSRFFEPRADRYVRLAERSRLLVDRLQALGVAPEIVERARDKARFEDARSRYPVSRLRRLPIILALARAGYFRQLSSQRSIDIVRDLLQPA